jgi:hypothetical protein
MKTLGLTWHSLVRSLIAEIRQLRNRLEGCTCGAKEQ